MNEVGAASGDPGEDGRIAHGQCDPTAYKDSTTEGGESTSLPLGVDEVRRAERPLTIGNSAITVSDNWLEPFPLNLLRFHLRRAR
jgi:hypothetical protein